MRKLLPFVFMLTVATVVAQSVSDELVTSQCLVHPHPEGIRPTSDRSDAIPAFDITQVPPHTKGVIKRTATNNTPSPITFTFSGMPGSDEYFVNVALGQLTNPSDTPLSRLQLVEMFTHTIKSPSWQNHNIIAQPDLYDSVTNSRKYSLIGEYLSQFSRQCGDFWQDFCHLCLLSGYFTSLDLQDVWVPGHSYGQVCLTHKWPITAADRADSTNWHMRDMDVGTPNAVFADSANPLGYNYLHVSQHAQQLATGGYTWNGKSFATHQLDEYQALLSQTPTMSAHIERIFPTGMTSQMKIPAGGKITQSIGPLYVVHVSFTDGSLQLIGDTVENLMGTQGEDSAANYLSPKFHIPAEDIKHIFRNEYAFVLLDTALGMVDGLKYPVKSIPSWELEFTTAAPVANLTDVCQFPLIYLGGTGDQTISDTTGNCDLAETLWRPGQSAPALVTAREFGYVQSGSLGIGAHHISMAINGNIIFPTAEWSLNADGPLDVTTAFEAAADLPSGINEAGSNDDFVVYPNPATDQVTVSVPAQLVDALGRVVYHLNQGSNSLAGISAGTYLVVPSQGPAKKLVIFKN